MSVLVIHSAQQDGYSPFCCRAIYKMVSQTTSYLQFFSLNFYEYLILTHSLYMYCLLHLPSFLDSDKCDNDFNLMMILGTSPPVFSPLSIPRH